MEYTFVQKHEGVPWKTSSISETHECTTIHCVVWKWFIVVCTSWCTTGCSSHVTYKKGKEKENTTLGLNSFTQWEHPQHDTQILCLVMKPLSERKQLKCRSVGCAARRASQHFSTDTWSCWHWTARLLRPRTAHCP